MIETQAAIGILENVPFTETDPEFTGDFLEETDPRLDIVGVQIELPVDPAGIYVRLPIAIDILFTLSESGIDAVDFESQHALPVTASIAGDNQSASGVLPSVTRDGSVSPETIFADGSARVADGYGVMTIADSVWTFTLDQPPPLSGGQRQTVAVRLYSLGPANDQPVHHPWLYTDPRDRVEGETLDPPFELPQSTAQPLTDEELAGVLGDPEAMQAALAALPVAFDPELGRVPGEIPQFAERDARLGLQICLLSLGDDARGSGDCC